MTRNAQSTLQRQLRRGGALPHDEGLDKKAVVDAAHELGLALFVAIAIRRAAARPCCAPSSRRWIFPNISAGNLDALYDCLCDTVPDHKVGVVLWLYRLHSGDPALEEDAARIEAVCADAAEFAHENGRIFAYVVEHAGRHPDPEPGVAASLTATTNKTEGRPPGWRAPMSAPIFPCPPGRGRCHQPSRAAAAAISAASRFRAQHPGPNSTDCTPAARA